MYKNKTKTLLNAIYERDRQIEVLTDLSAGRNKSKGNLNITKKSSTKTGNAAICIVVSDMHIEEKVDPSVVNFLNSYDPKEAKRRMENLFRNGLFLSDFVRKGINADTLILALLGDGISGYIHDELIESNHLSPTEAILYLQDMLCDGIEFMIKEGGFKNIIIPCKWGNHGRLQQKKKINTAYANNLEWLMYHNMAKIYSKTPNVDFIIDNSYHTYLKLWNGKYTIRFHHGDSIKYGGGIGGITIPVKKAIAAWNTSPNGRADLDVFGHFHQYQDNMDFVCNGSLIGPSPYSIEIKAPYQEPCQSFFVVDKNKGKTLSCPIFVK